jgi:hypothetical protein
MEVTTVVPDVQKGHTQTFAGMAFDTNKSRMLQCVDPSSCRSFFQTKASLIYQANANGTILSHAGQLPEH